MKLIEGLAKEIGADYRAEHECPRFLAIYVLGLVDSIRREIEHNETSANTAALPIAVLLGASLRAASKDAMSNDELALVGDQASELIDLIDSDDGWPQCPWLNALKACALAIQFGLDKPPAADMRTRWPAEAGIVTANLLLDLGRRYNAETHQQRMAWVNAIYAQAASWGAAA